MKHGKEDKAARERGKEFGKRYVRQQRTQEHRNESLRLPDVSFVCRSVTKLTDDCECVCCCCC